MDQFDFTMARATQYKATGIETSITIVALSHSISLENGVTVLKLERTLLITFNNLKVGQQ